MIRQPLPPALPARHLRLPLLLAAALAWAAPALAGPVESTDSPAVAEAAPPAAVPTEPTVSPDEIDWSELDKTSPDLPKKSPSAPKPRAANQGASWSRNDRPDGSAAVGVKSALTPFWDTQIGADFSVAKSPTQSLSELPPETILNGNKQQSSTGSAWASVTAPGVPYLWDKTSIEARVDPSADQSKLGTTLSKSLPIWSDRFSLTLLQGYRLTEQTPLPIGTATSSNKTVEIERAAKFNIGETGTSLLAGQTLSTADDRWLGKVGAEQKVFGDVSVSGTVSQTATGPLDKRLTAGFKKTW